jgi:hypothetical protein
MDVSFQVKPGIAGPEQFLPIFWRIQQLMGVSFGSDYRSETDESEVRLID